MGGVMKRSRGSRPERESPHATVVRRMGEAGRHGRGGRRPREETNANCRTPGGLRADLGPRESRPGPSSRRADPSAPGGDAWHPGPAAAGRAAGLRGGRAAPVRSGRQVGQRLVRGTLRAPGGERERERARTAGATSNRRRPLAGPRGRRRARPPARRGARGQRWQRLPWALTRSPEHTTRAAASSLPGVEPRRPQCRLGDRPVGASQSDEAREAQAASPRARRCPREGREGARAGWGRGASPSLPLPAPRACSRRTCLAPGSLLREPRGHGARLGLSAHVEGR